MSGARRDARVTGAILAVALIFLGGLVVTMIPREVTPAAKASAAAAAAPRAHAEEIERNFQQGVAMLHAKRFEFAVTAFHQVLRYAPDMPEAHVNMGFALEGLGRHKEARDFFESATALRPRQANAYYGMAVALEGMGDLRGAIGAMRTYVHLTDPGDPYKRRAESALWEWEEQVKSQN
jgi:tetratricopeptide (TPR) repeat protein